MGKLIIKSSKSGLISEKISQKPMKLREARKKIFGQGGEPSYPWGGTENFLDGGGQVLMGGGSPFMGYGPPPIPPPC